MSEILKSVTPNDVFRTAVTFKWIRGLISKNPLAVNVLRSPKKS